MKEAFRNIGLGLKFESSSTNSDHTNTKRKVSPEKPTRLRRRDHKKSEKRKKQLKLQQAKVQVIPDTLSGDKTRRGRKPKRAPAREESDN